MPSPKATDVEQLRETVAALTERVAFLEQYSPQAQTRLAEIKRLERKSRNATVYALTGSDALKRFKRMHHDERREFIDTAPRAIVLRWTRETKGKERTFLLSLLDHNTRAAVVFELAPAPEYVEVTARGTFETNPIAIDAEQARTLTAAGVPVTKRANGAELRGFNAPAGEVFVFDAAAWRARCACDARIPAWVAQRKIGERALSDDEARAHGLRLYLDAWSDRKSPNGGPSLPEI